MFSITIIFFIFFISYIITNVTLTNKKYKKRKSLLEEYSNISDKIFDFYRNNTNNLIKYKEEYTKFFRITNIFIASSEITNEMLIIYINELKDLYSNIIPSLKKEKRKKVIKKIIN